jgi:hypothetical protein
MSDTSLAEPGTGLQKFLDRAGLRGFPWKIAVILYTISWGWLFIVRNSLWADDWFLFVNFDFRIQGFAPWIDIQIKLMRSFGLTFFRSLTFIGFLMAAVFLFGITRQILFLSLSQRRLVVLLFLLLPFNTTRVALMVYWYTIGYLVFFSAWYLAVSFRSRRIHFLSVGLFFTSFQLHSLLPFYLLPVLHLMFLSDIRDLRNLILWLRMNLYFFLPPTYWIFRSLFWPERVGYHDVSVSQAASAFPFVAVALVLFGTLAVLNTKVQIEHKNKVKILLSGFVAVFAGMLAYVVLGFFKSDWSFFYKYFLTLFGRSDWYSRHQILQPLGVALLVVGAIALLPKRAKKLSLQVQIAVLTFCVVFNVAFGFEYVVDYAKQREVVTQLKVSGESDSISGFTFIDQTALLNARGREYRYRDWQGLISLAFDSELQYNTDVVIETSCSPRPSSRLVLIQGPETHWRALTNWVSDGDMGFKVTVNDTPGACKPEMVTAEKVSGAIPILFYFTGARN